MGWSRLAGQRQTSGRCSEVHNPPRPTPRSWPGGPGLGLITPERWLLSRGWVQMTQLRRRAPAPRAHLLSSRGSRGGVFPTPWLSPGALWALGGGGGKARAGHTLGPIRVLRKCPVSNV